MPQASAERHESAVEEPEFLVPGWSHKDHHDEGELPALVLCDLDRFEQQVAPSVPVAGLPDRGPPERLGLPVCECGERLGSTTSFLGSVPERDQ
jgi:hypothetical protein